MRVLVPGEHPDDACEHGRDEHVRGIAVDDLHPAHDESAVLRRDGHERVADVEPGRRKITMDSTISQCVTRTGISHT